MRTFFASLFFLLFILVVPILVMLQLIVMRIDDPDLYIPIISRVFEQPGTLAFTIAKSLEESNEATEAPVSSTEESEEIHLQDLLEFDPNLETEINERFARTDVEEQLVRALRSTLAWFNDDPSSTLELGFQLTSLKSEINGYLEQHVPAGESESEDVEQNSEQSRPWTEFYPDAFTLTTRDVLPIPDTSNPEIGVPKLNQYREYFQMGRRLLGIATIAVAGILLLGMILLKKPVLERIFRWVGTAAFVDGLLLIGYGVGITVVLTSFGLSQIPDPTIMKLAEELVPTILAYLLKPVIVIGVGIGVVGLVLLLYGWIHHPGKHAVTS